VKLSFIRLVYLDLPSSELDERLIFTRWPWPTYCRELCANEGAEEGGRPGQPKEGAQKNEN